VCVCITSAEVHNVFSKDDLSVSSFRYFLEFFRVKKNI